uniref:hypothetical chloroplast RF1 n=1 Tax=Epilobium cylindricum TaxID=1045339 RepID=UPI001EF9DD9F|nr:hypothetical chloroplast RF1 [Epilobium cylindricum]UKH50626.1 hypothetical chloroplast RF1 [Epilobium cylindricum]
MILIQQEERRFVMIFKSFLLVNLVSLCMKISNSVVMVGLYYGFISAFSMGCSYLFLLRPRFLEGDQDAIEKKVSETAGFFTGQLLVFISMLYAPLHLALGRPHTLLLLVPPYFFFHFLCNNRGQYPDSFFALEFTNSMRNLRIQWVFLNNLLFQLLSLSLLARPMLTRLNHIYIFRCNNKIVFVLSSFVGWLIGHILVVKWVGLVLVWILKFIRSKRMKYITSNVLIPWNKYIIEKLRNSFVPGLIREIFGMKRIESVLLRIKNYKGLDDALWWIKSSLLVSDIKLFFRFYVKLVLRGFENVYMRSKFIEDMEHLFSIVLFATFLFYLDRTPFLFRDPREKISEIQKKIKREMQVEEREMEVEKGENVEEEVQEKQEEFTEEHIYSSLISQERVDPNEIEEENSQLAIFKEDPYLFSFGKPLVTPLFDPQKSLRPLRYIKTCAGVEKAVKNETSQYFFYKCRSDGKERICFTYPPSLSTFFEMIQRKISSAFPRIYDQWRALGWSDPGSYTQWTYRNEQKTSSLSTEFRNRIKALDKKRSLLNVLARKKSSSLQNVLEKRKRLCNYKTKTEYLPEISDPFLTGAYRAKSKKFFSSSILNNNKTLIQNDIETSSLKKKNEMSLRMIRSSINKLHVLLIPEKDYDKLKKKIDIVNTPVVPIKKNKFSLFKSKEVKMDVQGARKFCKLLLNPILPDPQRIRKKAIGLKEITKKVPRWSYKLIDELEQVEGTAEGERMFADHDLRVLPFKRVAVFTEKDAKKTPVVDEHGNLVRKRKKYAIRFLGQMSDFRRGLIKGSARHDRRKAYVCSIYQVNPRSPLFTFRRRSIFSFFVNIAVQVKFFFETRISKKVAKDEKKWVTRILDNRKELRQMLGLAPKGEKDKSEEDLEDEIRIENVMEMWENIDFGQAIRALILLMHTFLRKRIVFPSLIIVKNIARILLFQDPEWSIDFARLKKETYAICTYNGMTVSEKLGYQQLPQNWTIEGLQIQVSDPFSLKPWYRFGPRSIQKDPKKEKEPKKLERDREVRFLTSFGILTDRPFGDLISPDWAAFFKPIAKELKKKIIKFQKKHSLILSKRFLTVLKKTKKWLMKSIFFLKRELSKRNPIALSVVRENSELTLSHKDIESLKKEQDLRMSNQRIRESLLQGPVRALKDDSLPEENVADQENELKDLDNQLREIQDHIDKVIKERKKIVFTPEPDSLDKLGQAKKNILKKLKRIKARLIRQKYFFLRIRKSYYFLIFFIKRISRNIKRIHLNFVRCAISIRKIHPKHFFEFSQKMSVKSIYKIETNKEKVYKTNIYKSKTKKKKNPFISIFKESLYDTDIRISENDIKLTNILASNKIKKSKGHSHLSSVSQAYVFYKLYQTQLINLEKLRYVLQYDGASLFLKKEIKDYFDAQHIFDSKLKHKNCFNSSKTKWKNWLKAHYQYNVSAIIWNSLSQEKWRTKVNQQRMDENTDLTKSYSNEKRINFFEANSLDDEGHFLRLGTYRGQKDETIKNSIKSYRYDLFSYQSINSEDKYVSPLCINNKQRISYNYNRRQGKLFDNPEGIALSKNFLVQNDLLNLYTFPDRKYFHWRLLPVGLIGLKQKAGTAKNWTSANSGDTVKYWTTSNGNTSIKPGVFLHWQNYERTKNQNPLFDWLGMNTEIPNNCISDLKGWFFPELIPMDLRYQLKPWIIPIKLLFVNQQGNANLIQDLIEDGTEKVIQNENEKAIQNLMANFLENKNIKRNTKLENPYKKIKVIDLALENKNKKENKSPGDLKAYTAYKLKRPFVEYLKNGDIRNIQVRSPQDADEDDYDRVDRLKVNGYELNKLKKLKDAKEIKKTWLTSIKRGRLKMEFSKTKKSLKNIVFTAGLFGIEPLRISRQNKDAQFLIYQMIKIPLIEQIDPYDDDESFEITERFRYRRTLFMANTNTDVRHKSNYDLVVPETVLSTQRRRELRILISFYSRNGNLIQKNPVFCKYVKNWGEVVDNNEKKKNKMIKSFLWPNYRLEDLACMNRYWFHTNNGSRFSMLRIHMYPRVKIR